MLLTATKINKDYSARPVLVNVDLSLKSGQKIGLVGANGSGKTTLLRILAGELEPSSGQVTMAKGCKIGYQSQRLDLNPAHTVLSEGLTVFSELTAQERELRELEQQLANNDELLLDRYAKLSHDFEERGGYSYPARTRSILRGLGFLEQEFSQPVGLLSGGQQSRLALAKLLLANPDLLLLDEPTNHLDISAINWLENYLLTFKGGLLMVSHDRRFLTNLASAIAELENNELVFYPGNYPAFVQGRELRREKWTKDYLAQQEYIRRTEDFIARNIEGQNSKQALSRRRELAKLDRLAPPPARLPQAGFKFEQRRPSGRHVVDCRGLSKAFGDKTVFRDISFTLERGERAALIGPNGCGKSTLLEIICGRQQPDSGSVTFGHYVEPAYYSQMREDLNGENTAAEEIWSLRPVWTRGEVQSLLARFLFRGDDAFKLVKLMSGGEASRLALAKLLLGRANFLVLDEPTNHLDLDSRQALENALDAFAGTILIVSHDRWFLNAVANITLEMSPFGVKRFWGNYDYWLAKKQDQPERDGPAPTRQKAPEPKATALLSPNEIYRRRQQLANLEQDIAAAEQQVALFSAALAAPGADHDKLRQLATDLDKAQAFLAGAYREWESVARELESQR